MSIARATARPISVRPMVIGSLLAVAVAALAGFSAYRMWLQAQADTQSAIALEQRQMVAQEARQRVTAVQSRARAIIATLDPLCSGAPPAVQGFLLVTAGAQGLQLRVTSNDASVKAPPGGLASGLVIDATGDESALARWLMRIDNNRDLRESITLQSITRPSASQDVHAPAQASAIDSALEIKSYTIDPQICAQVHNVLKV